MQDLQEVTHEVHYENYRSERMASGGATRKIKFVSRVVYLLSCMNSLRLYGCTNLAKMLLRNIRYNAMIILEMTR
jgi:septin family protein